MSMTLDEDGLLAERRLITVAEAAQLAQVAKETIHSWIRSGLVVVVRDGRRVYVGEQSVMDCELSLRQGSMGRPRAGVARGATPRRVAGGAGPQPG